MAGYTENRVLVLRDFDHVFNLSNHIESWPKLFTEYQSTEVLEKQGNEIIFRLTTFPSDGRPARTWKSRRTLDKKNAMATAERIDPLFPFAYMKIRWEYETLPSDDAVVMTWIQEFDVHPDCQFTVSEMESFLNKNTYVQLRAVKNGIENWKETLSP